MHILLGLLGAIGTIAIVVWRISIAVQAARQAGDAVEGLTNLPRKLRFQSRARKEGVHTITDPREAATVLMLSVARAGGEVTAEQKAIIRQQMQTRFEMEEPDAETMLQQAAWLSKDLPEPGAATDRMADLVNSAVTPKERVELEDMMAAVAAVEGPASTEQTDIIARYRRRTGG